MLVRSSLVARVSFQTVNLHSCVLTPLPSGAASDKVAALEKAGVHVTDSPAKIGSAMLKVSMSLYLQ
jgi:succinyl-CoA synthetase alpha subunit